MKKSKKILSLFLAVLMVLSSMTVCFAAFAEDETKTPDDISAVETAISNWYDNHRNNLYSTKDEDAKKAARAAYDEVNKLLLALEESERFELGINYYSWWLQIVSVDVARNLSSDPSKTPTTQAKIDIIAKNLGELEKVCGTIPEEYKAVLKGFEPYNVKVGSNYPLQNASKVNFKTDEEARKVLASFVENVKGFSERQLNFADYISINSSGGFYFGQYNLSTKYGTTINNLLGYLFYEAQDLNTETGADPKFTYSTYVQRDGSYSTGYTYSWKVKDKETGETYTAEDYVNDFNAYAAAYMTDIIEPNEIVSANVLDIIDKIEDFKGIKDAADAIKAVGIKLTKEEDTSVAEIRAALDKYNNLTENGKKMFDAISGSSNFRVYAVAKNVFPVEEVTPELAYSKTAKVDAVKLSDCKTSANNVLYDLMLKEFVAFVENTKLTDVTDAVVTEAKALYVVLPDAFRKQITEETMAKYTQIVKPASDTNDFAKEVAAFNQTKITRPENSEVAWTTGGIQSAVDGLWELVAGTLVPMISKDIDLSDGLDKVLKENVYTNEMVAQVLGLYAMLSRDETDLGMMGFTLGKVVNMICSPTNIAKFLEEDKYADVAEVIRSYGSFTETEDTNKLEALAAHQFENGDFGFKDGDREGFIDAVLAVLRPITTLLAPGSKALGLVSLNINMFDYIDAEGNYVEGVYSNLIPLLEQLGCTDLMTVEEYKENYYNKVEETSVSIAADQFLKPVIDSVLKNVLDVVSPEPLNGLIKILPRLAHIVDTDMLDKSVKAALSQMGLLSSLAANLDLSKNAINKALAQPIDLTDLLGITITLPPIDWAKLADCCTVESVKSASNSNDYFILRTGDTDTCFTTVFYYIYDVVFADADTYAALRKVITDNLGALASVVTNYTDKWVKIGAVDTYGEILNLLGEPTGDVIEKPQPEDPDPVDPEKPTDPSNPTNPSKPADTNKPSLDDLLQNKVPKNPSKSNVKNPSIPKTGAEKAADALIAVSALVAVGAAGSLMMLKRKKNED